MSETNTSLWDAATAYDANDIVVGSDGNVYTSLSANTGHDPTSDSGVHWQEAVAPTASPSFTGTAHFAGDAIWAGEVGPVLTDEIDGHTYRLLSTSGVISTETVT